MKMLLVALLSACKLTTMTADDLRQQTSNHPVYLDIAPAGMLVEVKGALGPGNVPLPQAFYRVRTAKQEFRATTVAAQPLQGAAVTFAEIVLAWRSGRDTWVCFLQDVAGSMSIDPRHNGRCYRQDAQHDYLRQFVKWCTQDNKYDSPFFIANDAPYCKVGKISAINTVRIPLSCFTGNANRCFPPEKRSIRRAGRNDQRVPDKRFKPDEYYISRYLRTRGTTFTAMLDELYAQAADCRDAVGMEVSTPAQGHPFSCYCPQHKNKTIHLNGKARTCGATGYYYFFADFKSNQLTPSCEGITVATAKNIRYC